MTIIVGITVIPVVVLKPVTPDTYRLTYKWNHSGLFKQTYTYKSINKTYVCMCVCETYSTSI